eukprot:gb/GECG01016284.1/.p1 GENE.gb/GECG01016284.1/~~gb/GECG01016284.1/.p1  ORF type:complete len:743 (+),score=87.13 gb/GECG01016284.1/:1-2229(+)
MHRGCSWRLSKYKAVVLRFSPLRSFRVAPPLFHDSTSIITRTRMMSAEIPRPQQQQHEGEEVLMKEKKPQVVHTQSSPQFKYFRRLLNECARVSDLDQALRLVHTYTTFDLPATMTASSYCYDDGREEQQEQQLQSRSIPLTADLCSVVVSICAEAAALFAPSPSPCLHSGGGSYTAEVRKENSQGEMVTLSLPLFPTPVVTAVASHRRRGPVNTKLSLKELITVVDALFEHTKYIQALENEKLEKHSSQSAPKNSKENLWSLFARLFCILDRKDDALNVFKTMLDYGVQPRLRTFTPLIAMLGSQGEPMRADGLLQDLLTREELYPSEANIGYVIYAYYQRAKLYGDIEFVAQSLSIQDVLAGCRGPSHKDNSVTWRQRCHQLMEIAMDYHYTPSVAFHDTIVKAMTLGAGPMHAPWAAEQSVVGADGFVPVTGDYLQSLDLTEEETNTMLKEVSVLAGKNKRTSMQFDNFKRWLQRKGKFDVIIDGANVAFFNQNFSGGGFHHLQVDDVVQHFIDENKKVLLVLHNKWLSFATEQKQARKRSYEGASTSSSFSATQPPQEKSAEQERAHEHDGCGGPSATDRHPRNPWRVHVRGEGNAAKPKGESAPAWKSKYIEECTRKWRESGVLYECQRGNNDDWYWLYASLWSGKDCVVVTNDQMRDHHFQMLSPKNFLKWRERHQCYFHIQSFGSRFNCKRKVSFDFPLAFSHRMQPNNSQTAWYIPHPQDPNRWTCLWQTPSSS